MRWPPYKHVFFDCDSTLTSVEGINVLAEGSGKKWRVEVLTRAAMDGELALEEIYGKRLTAVRPTRAQVNAVRQVYKRNVIEDAAAVIRVLKALGHEVYIISGGLAEPVREFGLWLGVPRENIRAVEVRYNKLAGTWWRNEQIPNVDERYMQHGREALTISDGKAQIVEEILNTRKGRSLLIGDGVSDLLAGRAVDLFVGYGGVVARPRVVAEAACFIHSRSLAPLLAIAAGPAMLAQSSDSSVVALRDKIRKLLEKGAVTFQDERLGEKFRRAYQTVYSRTD